MQKSQFLTWKSTSGPYLWFAMWSNKYRDRDYPPEILAEAAHIDYVKAVNDGTWPYPELWIYHVPGSAWGDATYVDYDKANGIAIAGGTVRPGLEAVAEALNSTPASILVSHGMSRKETRRDDSDPTVLTRYRTKEISPLPDFAAANELTGFVIGGNMKILDSAKARLIAVFGETKADEIADLLDVTGTEAKDLELEHKETDVESVEKEVEDATPVEVEPVKETEAEPIPDPDLVDRKEMEAVVTRMTELMGDTNTAIKSLAVSMQEFADRITALEALDEKKITELVTSTPRASLIEIVNSSAIGKEQVKVDGRSTLARDIPKETKVEDYIVRTGHPMLSAAITDIVEHGTDVFNQGDDNG